MKLSDRRWKEFCLGDRKYFDVRRGDSVYIKDLGVGETPYISTTDTMQGVAAYTEACNRKGNLITLAYDGSIGTCYYQKEPFFASEKIVTIDLMQVSLNENLAMFIIPILKLEAQMYLYGGRKWAVNELLLKTNIKLPVHDNEEPDYQFMEDYIKSLNVDVSDVPDYFQNDGYDKACWYLDNIDAVKFEREYAGIRQDANIKLNDREWREFQIGGDNGLFECFLPDYDLKVNEVYPGEVKLITTTKDSNGCGDYVADGSCDTAAFEGNKITVNMFGYAFYQEDNFYTVGHGHVNILTPKFDMNKYNGLFVCNMINNDQYRFSFGRAVYSGIIENLSINLPVDADGKPDWQFMEDYIKSLPFSAKL